MLTLPVTSSLDDISEESGNRTAPPRLGLTATDPFHPSVQDIFDNTPSTARAEYFPTYSPDDEPRRSASPLQHHGRFWRSPGGRRYPSNGTGDDREESESLWKRELSSDEDSPAVTPEGGIRLVTSHRR